MLDVLGWPISSNGSARAGPPNWSRMSHSDRSDVGPRSQPGRRRRLRKRLLEHDRPRRQAGAGDQDAASAAQGWGARDRPGRDVLLSEHFDVELKAPLCELRGRNAVASADDDVRNHPRAHFRPVDIESIER